MNSQKQSFIQWYNNPKTWSRYEYSKYNPDVLKLAKWLFTLSSLLVTTAGYNNGPCNLAWYLQNSIYNEDFTLSGLKERIIADISKFPLSEGLPIIPSDICEKLFDTPEKREEWCKKIGQLDIHQELTSIDSRQQLDLSSTLGYYRAKKLLMQYYVVHGKFPDDVSPILDGVKFKFNISEGKNRALIDKLQQEIRSSKDFETAKTVMQIDKIIHAIRIGSTARGTSPFIQDVRALDVWGLSRQWVKKATKQKHIGALENLRYDINQRYDGAGNVRKGLEYVRKKVKAQAELLGADSYKVVVRSVQVRLSLPQSNSTAEEDLLLEKDLLLRIKQELGQVHNNVRFTVLQSIIAGYDDLLCRTKLSDHSDKILELLSLQELYLLIKGLNTSNQAELELELQYRSCIDLMSTIIALRLGDSAAAKEFLRDEQTVYPKVMEAKDPAHKVTSKICVARSGQEALHAGLSAIGSRYYMDKEHNKHTTYPGFHLKTVLSEDSDEKSMAKDIAVYWEVGGTRGEAKTAAQSDSIACVGRISETKYDIDQTDLDRLTKDIEAWCAEGPPPKTLCVDLTIMKRDDELVKWLKSEAISALVDEKKLDILVWQSEQKQQTLGTGKFSAGSVYLISANSDRIAQFNKVAEQSYQDAPDNNLSTFFRKHCTDAMHEVVRKQTESAEEIAKYILKIPPIASLIHSKRAMVIPNGPFVSLIFDDHILMVRMGEILQQVWLASPSFGFSQTTSSLSVYDNTSIRISVGLESKQTLLGQLNTILNSLPKAGRNP